MDHTDSSLSTTSSQSRPTWETLFPIATELLQVRRQSDSILKPLFIAAWLLLLACPLVVTAGESPNIVLVMTDDQGWGQTGYYDHPVLKTPHLDAMAENGLRFDRFYAGGPVCSPTRATVLTGRAHDRTGVFTHGHPLRRQEKTVAQALQAAGYATGHFGKWHLNGLRGPGVPIFEDDTHHPGTFGFDYWLSVTNYFDRDPWMSRNGKFEPFEGDSSEIIVDEAVKFISQQVSDEKPFFVIIWYGTPHNPFRASEADRQAFAKLDKASQEHYGELVAMDRSIGALRAGLRKLEVADDTLVWFCSDNGGLSGITPGTVGGLRGHKGTVYEGGLRVPGIVEWPAVIREARVTEYPTATLDIFPTIAEIVGLKENVLVQPVDGTSVKELFTKELQARRQPIPFRHNGRGAWLDNDWKLVVSRIEKEQYELYNLKEDPQESRNLLEQEPKRAARMLAKFQAWNETVEQSVAGKDYPEGKVLPGEPPRQFWRELEKYQAVMEQWGLAKPEKKPKNPKKEKRNSRGN